MNTIFLDMDGVVADFELMAQQILSKDKSLPLGYRYSDEEWSMLKSNPRIYRDLPLVDGSKKFVEDILAFAKEHNIDVLFLTANPVRNDIPWAFWDKVNWAMKYFPGIPVWFGPNSVDKQLRSMPGNVLIDDRLSNIEQWNSNGGKAIRFTGSFDEVFIQLKEYYAK
jgi:5'(3')-deoxyribonucleotidase